MTDLETPPAAPIMRPGKRQKFTKAKPPTLAIEKAFWEAGDEIVVGIDEVGKGAWAGPLTVGVAFVPRTKRIQGVRDSKMLTEDEREKLFDKVAGWCDAWAVGHATYAECDALGMTAAQKLATNRALDDLGVTPDRVLIDGHWDFVGRGNTQRIIKGDARSLSIAAASILAKVTRDRMMRELAPTYPLYNFENNKGYPCPRHKMALQAFGASAIHRRSWAFMDSLCWKLPPIEDEQSELFA